jgi:hypothetical protein
MDGVLVDLISGIGKPDHPSFYKLEDMYNRKIDISDYDSTWWAALPRTPFASDLVEAVLDTGYPVRVLTKACSPASAAGKIRWMQEHFPRFNNIAVIVGDKAQYAKSLDILIDDYRLNISEWILAGGYGITVPQPWNGLTVDVMEHVEGMLRGYRDTEHG